MATSLVKLSSYGGSVVLNVPDERDMYITEDGTEQYTTSDGADFLEPE